MKLTWRHEKVFTLELSETDAEVLRYICQRIGGPTDGPRSTVETLDKLLADAGVPNRDGDTQVGSIYLPKTWDEEND